MKYRFLGAVCCLCLLVQLKGVAQTIDSILKPFGQNQTSGQRLSREMNRTYEAREELDAPVRCVGKTGVEFKECIQQLLELDNPAKKSGGINNYA